MMMKYFNNLKLTFVKFITIFLIVAPSSFADEAADKAEFKRLYAEFNDLYVNSHDIFVVRDLGEKLYDLAKKTYGKNHQNTAVVTYNLAKVYDEMGLTHTEKKSADLYKEYFRKLNKLKTPKDDKYLDQYMEFVNSQREIYGDRVKDKYLNSLISMASSKLTSEAKKSEVELFVANLRYIKGDEDKALKLYIAARERYIIAHGLTNLIVANASLGAALIHFNNKDYAEAENSYLLALNTYNAIENTDKNTLANAHKNLARLYVETDRYELAANHGQKIVELANDPKQMFLPIVRQEPLYPGEARRVGQQGFVDLTLTVDKEGRTKDIKVLYSTDSIFEKNAIKAVEKFRFIPIMEDGKIVEVYNITTRMSFIIGDRKQWIMRAVN